MHLPALKLKTRYLPKWHVPPPPIRARSHSLEFSYVRNNHLPRFFFASFPPSRRHSFSSFPRQIKSAGLISTLRRSHELRMAVQVASCVRGRKPGWMRWVVASACERASAAYPPVRLWAPNTSRRSKTSVPPSVHRTMPRLEVDRVADFVVRS